MRLKSLLNMICCKRLKLNKFRLVSIPKNKDLFLRCGRRASPITDGQTAMYANGVMEDLSNIEAQLLNDNQMPLSDH